MKRVTMFFVIFCALLLTFGCMQRSRVADLTIMASKNISTLEGAKEMGVFEGVDCRSAWSGQMPNQEEALDIAVEKGGGNAMVDAVIYFKPAICLFDETCWEVKGTVIKTRDMFGELDDSDYIKEVMISPNGKKYVALKKRSTVDLDYDARHYDLIIMVK